MDNQYYSYAQPSVLNWRKLLFWVVVGLVVVIVLVLLYEYLTLGKLNVDSGSKTTAVSVTYQPTQKVVAKSFGALKVGLHPGKYIVSVSNQSLSSSQVISIDARHTTTVKLSISKTTAVEPVSDTTASYIVASSSQLYFLNSSGHLTGIDNNNNQTVINNSISFRSIDWVDSTFGVGDDTVGNVYTINNGSVGLVNPPANIASQNSLVAVSPDHTIYVAINDEVYKYTGGSLSKFYRAANEVTLMTASNSSILVVSSPDTREGSRGAAYVTTGGQVYKSSLEAFAAAFSPDGSLLVIGSSTGGQIYDQKLRQVATIPSSGFSNPRWLNSHVLLYSLNDQLWSYDTNGQISRLIANAPSGGQINELSVSDDGTYVYMGVVHLNGAPVIKRISLTGKTVSSTVTQLQSIMPYTSDSYFMSLINFTKTTVLVTPLPPLTNTNDQYLQEAQTQLSSLGIDTSNITVQMSNN